MKLVPWLILVIVAICWAPFAWFMAAFMYAIGGSHAFGFLEFWVYALSPIPMLAVIIWKLRRMAHQ